MHDGKKHEIHNLHMIKTILLGMSNLKIKIQVIINKYE